VYQIGDDQARSWSGAVTPPLKPGTGGEALTEEGAAALVGLSLSIATLTSVCQARVDAAASLNRGGFRA